MLNLCFVGDIFPGGVFIDHGEITDEVKKFFATFDLRIGNLESALYDGSSECSIKMNDPKLGNLVYSPERCVKVLKDLGLNVVSLANNHVCDCSYEGLSRTIEILDREGIAHFGAGRTKKEAEAPAIVNLKGKKICFLGYFPPEWEAPYPPSEDKGGLNQLYIDKVVADIQKYKRVCDYVFVMPHWGKEHTIFPLQVDVYRLHEMIKAGADGILGSHSHCPQTAFKWKNTVVFMSLGNLLFPDRYIIPPRKTYYPTSGELRNKKIPIVYNFPFVENLTMVKMQGQGRVGLVASLRINDDSKIEMHRNYTILDSANVLKLYKMPTFQQKKIDSIKYLIRNASFYHYLSGGGKFVTSSVY